MYVCIKKYARIQTLYTLYTYVLKNKIKTRKYITYTKYKLCIRVYKLRCV